MPITPCFVHVTPCKMEDSIVLLVTLYVLVHINNVSPKPFILKAVQGGA